MLESMEIKENKAKNGMFFTRKYSCLLISPNLIKHHVEAIYLKLGKIYLICRKFRSFIFITTRHQL